MSESTLSAFRLVDIPEPLSALSPTPIRYTAPPDLPCAPPSSIPSATGYSYRTPIPAPPTLLRDVSAIVARSATTSLRPICLAG